MTTELIPLSFDKIMQTKSYTIVVLVSKEKRFAIYTDPTIGRTLQLYLTGINKPRPLTHDLINSVLHGLQAHIKQIVINDVQDTIYYARLFLEQRLGDLTHIVEVDARPSDCITLAIMNGIPVFCTRQVLEKSVALSDD